MQKDHDESKLPKWAQDKLNALRREIDSLNGLRELHAFLYYNKDCEWFSIPGPLPNDTMEYYRLYVLYNNNPHQLCTLGKQDVLFIGRNSNHKLTSNQINP